MKRATVYPYICCGRSVRVSVAGKNTTNFDFEKLIGVTSVFLITAPNQMYWRTGAMNVRNSMFLNLFQLNALKSFLILEERGTILEVGS